MNSEFYTIALVVITVIVSLLSFNNQELVSKLILWPARMSSPAEYYRFLTCGFIHADLQHLLFNMFTMYFIGSYVETAYRVFSNANMYLLLYLSGIIISSIPSYIKHKKEGYYRSLGASGGVAAVLFALVYLNPWGKITVFVFPMWSILFAVLYIAYTVYASKQNRGYVNHDAHLWGSVYGFFFTLLAEPSHGVWFMEQIRNKFA